MKAGMDTKWLIEVKQHFDCPWQVICLCETKDDAEETIQLLINNEPEDSDYWSPESVFALADVQILSPLYVSQNVSDIWKKLKEKNKQDDMILDPDCDLVTDEKITNCVLCYRYETCKKYFEKKRR